MDLSPPLILGDRSIKKDLRSRKGPHFTISLIICPCNYPYDLSIE